ncbi:Nte1p, partial [Coemansia nantahalensis]
LLSILSLFAEGVPLRQGRRRWHQPEALPRVGSRGHMPQATDAPAYDQCSDSSTRDECSHPPPRRPNVVARATTDTTLAMIPASAFQRVTRLYPKAAAHILQVILTRLQRVTFATLYDYLDLPDELVAIERAISGLARLPLAPEIAQSDVLLRARELYAQADRQSPSAPPAVQSPVLGSQRRPSFSTRSTLSAGVASTHTVNLSDARQLPAAWKLTRASLEALPAAAAAMEAAPTPIAMEILPPPAANVDVTIAHAPRSRFRRHRRRGSDSAPVATLPSAADIEGLRRDALQQLCDSLGIDPHTSDGRPAQPVPPALAPGRPQQARDRTPPPLSAEPGVSSARGSRSSSTHRRPLPRTEYLLPLLQSVGPAEQRRAAAAASGQALEQLSSLTDEFSLYRVPDGQVLVEQGQRPPGLYIVLDGKVAITHRDSVRDFTGVGRDGERSFTTGLAKDPAAKTVSEVTRHMTQLALRVKTRFERRERARGPSGQPVAAGGGGPDVADLDSPPTRPADLCQAASVGAGHCAGGPRRSRPYYARAGAIVGYLPALTDMASLFTARSVGGVVIGFISHWALERMAERYPVILMTLARRLTSQLPAAILNIDYALEWVQVKASQMVYRQGESSDAVYVVLSGRLRAFVERAHGGVGILAEYGQGQSVGEPNLLLSEPCGFSLHAIRDTELVRIPRALFTALMRSAPSLTFHLSQTLAVRTTQALQQQHLMAERQRGERQAARPAAAAAAAAAGTGVPHPEAGIR